MHFNVKFNFGKPTTNFLNVTVVNVTPAYMTYESEVNKEGEIEFKAAPNMVEIHKLWVSRDQPTYFDVSNYENDSWGEDDEPEAI